MKQSIEAKRFNDLVRLLDQLHSLHEELGVMIQDKIDAMKRSDTHAMRLADTKELAIAERISEREGLRRGLMDSIGEQLGLAASHARALSLSQLAQRLVGKQRQVIERACIVLRQAVATVAKLNRVAAQVAQSILTHLDAVFASVTTQNDASADYTVAGRMKTREENMLFDAVG